MNLMKSHAPSALALLVPLAAASLLSACAMSGQSMGDPVPTYSQMALPAAMQVPEGHRVAMETTGVGKISYECREKKDMPGQFDWVFVGPDATLMDRKQQTVGRYYGPPATWESRDGSKITGTQLAVSPATPGSIPLQLVKANPAMGAGAMQGVSHIQRVATKGGVAPQLKCEASSMGQKQVVDYQADYIFWTPIAMK